jgi:hypothetical protein
MKTSLLVASLCILSSCTTTETKVQHVEIMTFRLTNKGLDQDFDLVNKEVNSFLQRQSGFISRELGKCNDSTWIDVLRWESIKHYEDAYAKSAEDQAVKDMSAMIDFSTVVPLSFDTH